MLQEQGSGRRMEPSLPGDIAAGFSEGELPPGLNGHVNGRPVNLPVDGGEPWVGIVANRSSGTGGNNILVRRLVGKLAKLGFGTEVAWTPDERQDARGRGGIAPGVPLPGGRGRRWNGLGAGQRATQGTGHRAAGRNREPRGSAFWIATQYRRTGPQHRRRAGDPGRPGKRRRPAIPADDRVRL